MENNFTAEELDKISQIKNAKLKISPFDNRNAFVRPPIKFCQLIADHPRKAFALSTSVYVFGIVLSVVLISIGFDLFPTRFAGIKMEVRSKSYVQRNKAFLARRSAPGYLPRVKLDQQEIQMQSAFFEVIFQTKDKSDNVLSDHHLKSVKTIQDEIMKSDGFDQFCLRIPGKPECFPPNSIISLSLEYGGYRGIHSRLNFLYNNPSMVNPLQQVLGKDSNISAGFSSLTRIQFMLGRPLYNSTGKEDDEERATKFLQEKVMPLLRKHAKHPPKGLQIYYFGKAFLDMEIERFTYKDMILIIGSFTFILILLCIHTKSLFIGLCGMASIVGSFVLANLVYRLIIGFVYFGVCHVLSIFVILGIGADDIFVFVDTWKQAGVTNKYQFPSVAHRLSHVYRQAATATAWTSLTTIIAFLASAMSPILAISSFGVFSGLLVLLTYLSVITFFPTAVIYSHYVIQWKWTRFCKKKEFQIVPEKSFNGNGCIESNGTKLNGHVPNGNAHGYGFRNTLFSYSMANGMTPVEEIPSVDGNFSLRQTLPDLLKVQERSSDSLKHIRERPTFTEKVEFVYNPADFEAEKEDVFTIDKHEIAVNVFQKKKSFGMCVRFFRGPLFHVLTHRIIRWFILSGFVALVGTASYFTSHLVPEDRQVKLLKSGTEIMKADNLRIHGFMGVPPDAIFESRLIWGLKPQDLSSCRFRDDDDCVGKLRLDPTFNMNSDEAQIAVRNLCLKFKNPTQDMIDNLRLRLHPTTKQTIFKCFMLDLERYVGRFMIDLPLNVTNVLPWMKARTHIYNISALPEDFNRYFEVMLTHWLTGDYMMEQRDNLLKYDGYLGEVNNSMARIVKKRKHRVKSHYGGSLAYMIISVETTLNNHVLGYPEGFKVGAAWDRFVEQEMKLMPNSCNKAFAESRKWRGLAISEALAKNAWQGVVIGISTSLFILTLTTMNIVVALIATLTIGLITNCVIAAIVLAGWKLGPLESINMCLVVGLAVDYVVHLAEAYNRSLYPDRINRVRDALEQVGVSVMSGAMTSLGASLFMIFANILFFVQFGIFMFMTIGLSFVFAIGFFCTFMGIFGPEGTFGCLRNCCRRKPVEERTICNGSNIPLGLMSQTVTT